MDRRSHWLVTVALTGLGCTGVVATPGVTLDGGTPGSGGGGTPDGSGGGTPGGSGGNTSGSGGAGGAANPADLNAIAAQYFPGTAVANAPKRMSRLTRTQLDLTTKTLLPTHAKTPVTGKLPADPLQTNYEYAANLGFNPANFTPYTTWVGEVVASVRANPASVINCAASNNSATCLQTEAKKFVTRAFRGTVTDSQATRYADLLTAGAAQVGVPDATADLVDVTLTSPNYVFRDEVLTDSAGVLPPAQRLQHMTYTLADAPPETVGLSSATPGASLMTADAVQKAVDRILATPEARAKLARFFTAWLEVKEADEFTIDPAVFPAFTPTVAAAVVEETKAFLNAQLSKAAPNLKDITQSTQSFVSSALASIYGVPDPGATKLVDLNPTQRLGIFTLAGVIASHSGPTTTRLVKRGVFFTRKVMCLPLGQPVGIDTNIPATVTGTERQKIESITAESKCAGCHNFINPFGFMQENYDAIGRFRTTDQGMPVNAAISVKFLDEGPLSTTTPIEALKAFTSSMRFKQCFVRQVFRFYTGRDELPSDDPLLRQMFLGFATSDRQQIVELLRVLATSAAFSQRTETP